MIAHLRGRLLSKTPNRVIIEAGGVGYEVSIPVSTFYELGEIGTEVSLHIYGYASPREGIVSLYGFQTDRERQLFERLVGVSGVGPKVAIAVLSGLELDELILALQAGDLTKIGHVPRVPRKTAERLVLELRGKLTDLIAVGEPRRGETPAAQPGSVEDDVLSALMNLGYTRPTAEAALREARSASPDGEFEDLLRGSLRLLARKFFK